MTSKEKILIALTSHDQIGDTGDSTGFYVSEAAEPWRVLSRAGRQVDFVSTRGGRPPRDGENLDDPVQRAFFADPDVAAKLASTPTPADIDPSEYRAVLFAGGHGTMWDFPDDKDLAQVTASVYEAGGVVAAVCHGPAALVNVTVSGGEYLVMGKHVAAFTDEEETAVGRAGVVPFLLAGTLRARGAIHTAAPNFAPHTVIDGRLVTGQNPASAVGVAYGVLAALEAS